MTTEEFIPGLSDEEVYLMNLDEWERVPVEFYDLGETWQDVEQEYLKENPPFDNDKITLMEYLDMYYFPPVRIPK